jgi:hypothetical protein
MCSHQPNHVRISKTRLLTSCLYQTSKESSPVRTAHLKNGFSTNPSRRNFGQTPRFLYPRVGGREEILILRSYAFRTKKSEEIKRFRDGWIVVARALRLSVWGCILLQPTAHSPSFPSFLLSLALHTHILELLQSTIQPYSNLVFSSDFLVRNA